MIFLWSRSW